MASTDDLIPLIYHEKQEPGSMLCAQHALNSLLREWCVLEVQQTTETCAGMQKAHT